MTSQHNPLATQIEQAIRQELDTRRASEHVEVNLVAEAVRGILDPDSVAPPLVAYASVMHIRERVRQRLRTEFDPVTKAQEYAAGETEDLFSGTLQQRYPSTQRGVYVLRDLMTKDDVSHNVGRMRKAGGSILKHADTLQAWDASR